MAMNTDGDDGEHDADGVVVAGLARESTVSRSLPTSSAPA